MICVAHPIAALIEFLGRLLRFLFRIAIAKIFTVVRASEYCLQTGTSKQSYTGCYNSVKEKTMAVKRIVANVAAKDIEKASKFYSDILGLTLVMDLGWIQTYSANVEASPQISLATEGGSGTAVPDLSIEIDNFDEVLQLVTDSEFPIEYGPVAEPWGVRRFYVRDPFNRLINILEHS